MGDDVLKEILGLCVSIDSKAAEIYRKLAECKEEEAMKNFWETMAAEETRHRRYWERLKVEAELGLLPQIFDKPHEVAAQLKYVDARVHGLLQECLQCLNGANKFVLAYRLEFYLLHPAFANLFHYIDKIDEEEQPVLAYDAHVGSLLETLKQYGAVTPELELLGETVQRLWEETKRLVIEGRTDPLSGALNRRGVFEALVPLSHLAQREGYSVAIMMIDVDDFKLINDTYGHRVGDEVIARVAGLIKARVRNSDIVGRYGGEEFIVYLSNVRPESLLALADEIRELVAEGAGTGLSVATQIPVTISVGAAQGRLTGDPNEALAQLIRQSDEALYAAKRKGKNCVEIHD